MTPPDNTSEEVKAAQKASNHKEERAKPEGEEVEAQRNDDLRNNKERTDKPGENLEEKENQEKKIWNDRQEHFDNTKET